MTRVSLSLEYEFAIRGLAELRDDSAGRVMMRRYTR